MKKPIILLALFAVLMVATLVWSGSRDRGGGAPSGGTDCNSFPQNGDGEVDKGRLKPWMKDCFNFKRLGKVANRYTKGVLLNPDTIQTSANMSVERRQVGSISGDDTRVVKLERISGGAIEAFIDPSGDEDDQQVCLCGPGDRLTSNQNNSDRICVKALEGRACAEGDDKGTLAIPPGGATIEFRSVQASQARSVE